MAATAEQIRHTVERYVDLIGQQDSSEQVLGLFADGATVEDPIGSGVRRTRAEIAEFYASLDKLDQSTELQGIRIVAGEAAFWFEIATRVGDRTFRLAPLDVMTFDDEGRITSMRAYWSEDDSTEG